MIDRQEQGENDASRRHESGRLRRQYCGGSGVAPLFSDRSDNDANETSLVLLPVKVGVNVSRYSMLEFLGRVRRRRMLAAFISSVPNSPLEVADVKLIAPLNVIASCPLTYRHMGSFHHKSLLACKSRLGDSSVQCVAIRSGLSRLEERYQTRPIVTECGLYNRSNRSREAVSLR